MKNKEKIKNFQKDIRELTEIRFPDGTSIRVEFQKMFLGCFVFDSGDVKLALATKIVTNDELEAIILVANFKAMEEYKFSKKEINSILAHEAGHFRIKEREYNCIDTEIAADKYSYKKFGKIHLITALLKCIEFFGIQNGTFSSHLIDECVCRLKALDITVTEIKSYDKIRCIVKSELLDNTL